MRRDNRVLFQRVAYLAAAAVISLAALPVVAVTVVGGSGTTGTPGSPGNPGTAGANGNTGTNPNALANANNNTTSNVAKATGGNGGDGGAGGAGNVSGANGGKGGDGAAAGTATALASQPGDVDAVLTDTATAIGGNGGNGGSGGNGFAGIAGDGGVGAAGGIANAQASGINSTADSVTISTTVTGGNGGNGGSSAHFGGNGGAGGVASIDPNTVTGFSTSGDVSLTAKIFGGNGGGALSAAGLGGAGAAETISNAVSGQTIGNLILEQDATGGNGGASTNAAPGVGGNASSSLTFTATSPSPLTITLNADGGSSSNIQGDNAAAGGTSTAFSNITSLNTVALDCYANISGSPSGSGGDITTGSNGFTAGNGGAGTSNATATTMSKIAGRSQVMVDCFAAGQHGGNVLNGVLGNGGNGGSAISTAIGSNSGPDPVSVLDNASGGNGGSAAGAGFFTGSAGSASALALATSTTGIASAQANADAGGPGTPSSGASIGAGANASATASATSSTLATAAAFGVGISGAATSTAKSPSTGLISFVQANATAPVDSNVEVNAQASNAQNTGTISSFTNNNVGALISASPISTDVNSAWSPAAQVKADFNSTTTNVNSLCIINLEDSTSASTASHTYSAVVDLNENNANVLANGLRVGLLNQQPTTAGLTSGDTIRFRIVRAGVTLVDQTLNSGSYLSYFTNNDFELGVANAGLGASNLDVQLLFDLTSTHPGDGFATEVAVGANNTPITGTWLNPSGTSWPLPFNWNNRTIPEGPGTSAIFSSGIDSSKTLTLDQNTTVGQISFNNLLSSYTIASGTGGSLFLDNAGAVASVSSSNGTHNISAPVVLTSPGVNLSASSTISGVVLSGNVSGVGPVNVLAGSGQIVFTGLNNTYTGNTIVNSGATLSVGNLAAAGSLPATTTLISNGVTEFFYNPFTGILPRTVAGLTLSSTGEIIVPDRFPAVPANRQVLITSALTFGGTTNNWQGLLDLQSNDMIVHGGSLADITNQLAKGHGSGSTFWKGAAGIISSAAAATPSKTALAVELNDDGTLAHNPLMTTFAGQTVTNTDVLVKYTFVGDADLSGTITSADYILIDNGFNSGGTKTGWRNGDFNYDGNINGDDYTLIDNAFNTQGTTAFAATSAGPGSGELGRTAEMIAADTAQIATPAVPEPSISLISLSVIAVFQRRYRRVSPRH